MALTGARSLSATHEVLVLGAQKACTRSSELGLQLHFFSHYNLIATGE